MHDTAIGLSDRLAELQNTAQELAVPGPDGMPYRVIDTLIQIVENLQGRVAELEEEVERATNNAANAAWAIDAVFQQASAIPRTIADAIRRHRDTEHVG